MHISRDELIQGLKAGRTLVVNRRDAAILPVVSQLVAEGLVEEEFVEYDHQSSALKFRWKQEKSADSLEDNLNTQTKLFE